VKAAALCAGYGGLELGLALAGWDVELAWVSEVDLHASKVLDARFAVPNLGDLTTITDPPPVDVVTAGFPCQPVSTAGKRKGTADARWLIDDVCDLARRAGVRWLVLENVPGLLTANDGDAMARVCSALAHNGFDAEWTHLRAADVGAPHGRLRWFCVAGLADGGDGGSVRAVPGGSPVEPGGTGRGPAADADGRRLARLEKQHSTTATRLDRQPGRHAPRRGVEDHRPGRFGPYEQAVRRWEHVLGRPAPDPTDGRRLNPRFVEWMMGLPDGWVTDVVPQRTHALRILGNGVVPQQAAMALRLLGGET
jgi:DNA (cytosine-5)-methyltransferase 1